MHPGATAVMRCDARPNADMCGDANADWIEAFAAMHQGNAMRCFG